MATPSGAINASHSNIHGSLMLHSNDCTNCFSDVTVPGTDDANAAEGHRAPRNDRGTAEQDLASRKRGKSNNCIVKIDRLPAGK